jgi:hypothetical protein
MNQLEFNISDEESKTISVIKDPFQTNCITNVGIHFSNNGFSNPYWYGYVKFKNGNTEGEQKTNHTQSFEEIVVEIRQILNSLNNK